MGTLTSESRESGRCLRGVALFGALGALLLTLFLEALDNTSVGPAMPRIINYFQGFDRYTWVVTAYLLTSTVVIPVVGKLSDQFGRKRFLLVGAGTFILASLLSGASQNMEQLIIFRAFQGLGAGIGMSLVATVIGDIFPPAERAKGQSTINIVYALSNLIGPSVGGWLTDHGPLLGTLITNATRWRWIFYLNLPLGIIAMTALSIYLPASVPASTSEQSHHLMGWRAVQRIDFPGAFLCIAATVCLLLGLSWGSNQSYSWNSPQVIGVLVAASVFVVVFLMVERRATEAILPLNLFRNQVFAADAVLSLLVYMILLGLAIYLPLFLQGVLAISPTSAGVLSTPLTISVVIGATLFGWLISIRKRYQALIIGGTLLMAFGVFFMTRMTPLTGLSEIVVYMVLAGLGIGSIFSVTTLAAQNSLPPTHMGVGTAAVRYLGQLGSTLGVAIVGTVVNLSLTGELVKHLPVTVEKRLILAVAIQHGFLAVLVFCGIAVLAVLYLKDVPTGTAH